MNLILQSSNNCDSLLNNDARSAYERAKTDECKQEIQSTACSLQENNLFNYKIKYKSICPNVIESQLKACLDQKTLENN